jgi:Mannosyl-glycoprotein endo-beta-N-acetylglucosaminidase/S-layer homology domain
MRARTVWWLVAVAWPVVVMALLALGPLASPGRAAGFADVGSGTPYYLQVQVADQLGIVHGYDDGNFRPNDSVSRKQFAKMLAVAMRIPVSEGDLSTFADVPATTGGELYPDHYIAALAKWGIVSGTKDATATQAALFSPDAPVTLAQMVTMASRVPGAVFDSPLAKPPSSYHSTWGDFNPSHAPAARLAQYNGLLREFPLGSMDPWRNATRAEAVALLFNLMGTDPQGLNGRFLGDSADLVRFFREHNTGDEKFTIAVDKLAKMYVLMGRRFGVRADMAWAQMVHETNFGRYTGDVQPAQNNFAGIGATGGIPGNSFATPELGVIAQYAHLAWYVYPTHLDDPYCVSSLDPTVPGDPRHFVTDGKAHRGNVRTVQDLSLKWAVGSSYGDAIMAYDGDIELTKGW